MKSFGGDKKRSDEATHETPLKKAASSAGTPSPSAALAEEPTRMDKPVAIFSVLALSPPRPCPVCGKEEGGADGFGMGKVA